MAEHSSAIFFQCFCSLGILYSPLFIGKGGFCGQDWIAFMNGYKNRYWIPCHGSSAMFSAKHEWTPSHEASSSLTRQQVVTSSTVMSLLRTNDTFCSCIGWSLLETLYSLEHSLKHFSGIFEEMSGEYFSMLLYGMDGIKFLSFINYLIQLLSHHNINNREVNNKILKHLCEAGTKAMSIGKIIIFNS